MRLLFLCEGPPENPDKAGSGSPAFLIQALRAHGAQVVAHDTDLSGVSKYAVAALSWRPDSRRWRALYRLGRSGRHFRDRRATQLARLHPDVDAILQYGATFSIKQPLKPLFVYCDDFFHNRREDPHRPAAVLTEFEKTAAESAEQYVYDSAAKIFTMSEYLNREFTSLLGVPQSRLQTVFAGTNLQTVPEVSSVQANPTPTVLFVGREFGLKGGETMLRAFRRIRSEVPTARLVIIGPRDLRLDEPGVQILGFLRKSEPRERALMERAYRDATVFCLPTESESFGIAVLEALLYEVPVVTTHAWALPESIIDGITGYTVPMGDDQQIAERVVSLLRNPTKAKEFGRAGRALVLERYDWSAVAQAMLDSIALHLKSAPTGTPQG